MSSEARPALSQINWSERRSIWARLAAVPVALRWGVY